MHIVVNYPCLSPSKRKKVEQAHLLSLCCPKVSQSSPPAGGESSGIIFSGGVYVGENTAQSVSVRLVRKSGQPCAQRTVIQSSGKPEGVPRWAKSPGRKPRAFAVFSGLLLLGRAGKQGLQALGEVQLAQLQELADGIRDRGCVCAAVRLQEGLRKPEQHRGPV